jgi:hypothetical protein
MSQDKSQTEPKGTMTGSKDAEILVLARSMIEKIAVSCVDGY